MIYKSVDEILQREIIRQNTTVELIASENFASQAVMDLCGSIFKCCGHNVHLNQENVFCCKGYHITDHHIQIDILKKFLQLQK